MLPEEATGAFAWPTDRSGTVKARMRRLGEAVADARGGAGRSPTGQVEFLLYALTHEDMRQRLSEITSMGPTRTKERLLELLQDPGATLPNGQTALVSLTAWSRGFPSSAPSRPDRPAES
jgi:hypothetical protein